MMATNPQCFYCDFNSSVVESVMVLLIILTILCHIPLGLGSFTVLDYGAIGDGETDDSQAFVKAWEATCGAETSALLKIPSDKTFLLSNVYFEGPCKSSTVQVSILGDIVGSEKGTENNKDKEKWIGFSNVNGLIVDGSGKIDGRGQGWWDNVDLTDGHAHGTYPTTLQFHACDNLRLSGLTLLNSPRNHISINTINGAILSNLKILAPKESPNTDGIDISKSSNIQILESFIGTGDDCIAINDGSSFINITNVQCGPGHGISVGSLGQEGAHQTVEGIHVSHCNFTGTENGVRIKTWPGGSGYAKSITFENITLNDVHNPIIIDQYYCNGAHKCPKETSNVQVSDIRYQGVTGNSAQAEVITLRCSEVVPCIGIIMVDVGITSTKPGMKPYANCLNANGKEANTSPNVPCLT